MDASPTKAWLIGQRNETTWQWHYQFAFGKRPAEELYDLRADPDQTKNVADEPAMAEVKRELADRLTKILVEAQDPRVVQETCVFEQPPFTDAVATPPAGKKSQRKAGTKR